MKLLEHILDNNRAWAEAIEREDPGFFAALARQQTPQCLWIGCSDSRVPVTQVAGLPPGEIFVHRNIANVVAKTDTSCLAVIHYAVEVLQVRHIIVCGHYGCGGVKAAMETKEHGFLDKWLCHVKDVGKRHAGRLAGLDDEASYDLMCELNVREQARNVRETAVVQEALKRGQELQVHGWIYNLADGLLKDLEVGATR